MLICNGLHSPWFPSGSPIYHKLQCAKNNKNNTSSEVEFGRWALQEPSCPSCGFAQTLSSFSCPLFTRTAIAKGMNALPAHSLRSLCSTQNVILVFERQTYCVCVCSQAQSRNVLLPTHTLPGVFL